MKHLVLVAIFLSILCVPLMAAENGMNETGKAFVKAFNANDLEAVVALYAPDAELFPPDAMQAKGKDAIRASYAAMMKDFTVKEIKIVEAEHITTGDTSVEWGLFHLSMVPKAGGEAMEMDGRFVDVSKKINGKWLYIADHASVPLGPPPQTAP